jgi:hypothetical protein
MDSIIAVAPIYIELTHQFVNRLKKRGLEKLSNSTKIPINVLSNFSKTKDIDLFYVPLIYSSVFPGMSPLEVKSLLNRDKEVEYI